ncbi:putative repair protein Rad1/Rec1/Rad17 [Lyophyllum shimeji]|uniref:Repair protein Rad1/Rec1/Rad17 n=1 Tax=Lyophyllum shimeji TaxID=47721 RepID=A0A9P3PH92_LYOSH|nr:putative repair protein Rad1/Rec1/Rad17 [Lyophyllum shimeji]
MRRHQLLQSQLSCGLQEAYNVPRISGRASTSSVHDVRYFATLLRGVNFVNRATITVTERGLTITVEEARTLLGTAFIFCDIFDEYAYHSPNPPVATSQGSEDADIVDNVAFEVPLNTLIECLNIFGTAGPASTTVSSSSKYKKWRKAGEDSDHDGDDEHGDRGRSVAGRGIDSYFTGGSEKRTSMRMTYAGEGHPLTLLLAEDATGPTTTCEITTFDPEPHLELDFDNSRMVLKIILKSSWLRDALSELDPSFDKLTFIGNPPQEPGASASRQKQKFREGSKPMLRIQAAGTFGSTEMDYPNDRDVLETFECTRSVRFSYRFAHISRTLRALQNSTKTSLRIDEEGLLSLQFLMPSPKPKGASGQSSDAFIDFRCLALDEEL